MIFSPPSLPPASCIEPPASPSGPPGLLVSPEAGVSRGVVSDGGGGGSVFRRSSILRNMF